MPARLSKSKQAEIQKRKVQAYEYFQKGLTLDEIGRLLGRTREWSRWAISEIENQRKEVEKKFDKIKQ